MNFKLNEVIGIRLALETLSKKELKVKVSFKTALNIKLLDPIYKSFEDSRNNLIKSFGEEKEGSYIVPEDKKIEFFNELDKLGVEDVSVELKEYQLDEFDGLEIKPETFTQLMPIIKEMEA